MSLICVSSFMPRRSNVTSLCLQIMDWLNPVAVRLAGANINRRMVESVQLAGFDNVEVSSHLLNIVKSIDARKAG